jgi:hypothetical protein
MADPEIVDPVKVREQYGALSRAERRRKFGGAAERHRAFAEQAATEGERQAQLAMAVAAEAKLTALGG